jgi:hypothetical protein
MKLDWFKEGKTFFLSWLYLIVSEVLYPEVLVLSELLGVLVSLSWLWQNTWENNLEGRGFILAQFQKFQSWSTDSTPLFWGLWWGRSSWKDVWNRFAHLMKIRRQREVGRERVWDRDKEGPRIKIQPTRTHSKWLPPTRPYLQKFLPIILDIIRNLPQALEIRFHKYVGICSVMTQVLTHNWKNDLNWSLSKMKFMVCNQKLKQQGKVGTRSTR